MCDYLFRWPIQGDELDEALAVAEGWLDAPEGWEDWIPPIAG